ncbi:MAG: Ppx/GppA family phosphatase [Deltaproteobacteria bacterium]|nr:Ppx/GppA family phosphatase [Deltaproteobacteria bacterium]
MTARVAAIDIGTNTVLMLIAERRGGEVVAVEEHAEITRLGQGVDRTRRLDDAAVARTLETLERYAARARSLGVARTAAVATSAARDATNGDPFRARAAEILGGGVDVASGGREATLTFRGALGGLGIARGAPVAVIDVGGGSTEIVTGAAAGSIAWAHSYDVGSVRLTERHVRDDPPSEQALAAVRGDARVAYEAPSPPRGPWSAVVAIAGTATTYAAIDLELVDYASAPPHGHQLSLDAIEALVGRLASVPLEERRRTTGLEPKRADVIVAGGLVLVEAARALGADGLVVSDRGVRWGLAEELLERP